MGRVRARAHRIRQRAEFLAVQNGATSRIRTASLLVLARPRCDVPRVGEGDLPTRLGVVASRRVGGAVQRNRAKRLIREAFRLARAELPVGLDLVIIASPSAATRSFSDIERELSRVRRDLRRAFGGRALAGPSGVG